MTLYNWSSLRSLNNDFWKYDTTTDSWSQLSDYHTGSNFAVDASGNMYSYSGDRTAINKYDPMADAWNFYMSAPTIGGTYDSTSYNFSLLSGKNAEHRF